MRVTLTILLILFLTFQGFSQVERIVHINPVLDTANADFKEIFNFWEMYLDELNAKSIRTAGLLNKMDDGLNAYWDEREVDTYNFVDLYYSYMSSIGNVWFTNDIEYFLGVAKRDSDLFELKTIFVTRDDSFFKGFPSIIITVPIRKINGTFKLQNKFSFNKTQLKKRTFANIIYYYPETYSFNDSIAGSLNHRVETFKKNFQINNRDTITYLVANNKTEISKWFGIDYYNTDFLSASGTIQGGYITSNKIILSGGGGENYLHEIIHLLLSEIQHGRYIYFEEGLACYFSEHVGKPYSAHIGSLKEFLNQNSWIDLSKSLYGYSKDSTGSIIYKPQIDDVEMQLIRYRDERSTYNFQYMINAVICDIAFRMGSYDKVMELFRAKADNEQDFYRNVEFILGIKQDDLNNFLRDFVNSNY
jgi:hypothetical protein